MLRLLPLAAVLLFACSACSKKAPAPADDEGSKLAVGDPAPPLTVARWLRGNPVTFEPGKAYVVDFWAIWCGPCLSAMGHLDELARKYHASGLTVVGVTTTDDRGNTAEAVEKFLAGRGKPLGFTFALCDKRDTELAYLMASGNTGLPATFVIDKAGKVAYIGHPDDLDEVVPKVLDGSWRGPEDATALKKQEAELDDILSRVQEAGELAQQAVGRGADPKMVTAYVNRAVAKAAGDAVGELDKYAAKYPGRAAKPTVRIGRARILMLAKKYDDARKLTEPVLEESAARRNPDVLRLVLSSWADRDLNPERRFPELPVRAADEVLKIFGESSPAALKDAAKAYYFAGEKVRGQTYADKAVALVTDPQQKAALLQELKEYAE